ncbi:MAG: peptidoglycan recognition protein, partial [Actinomycetota bacterium]|nr:peptidoglycan recognition protein [Actinomycetota bacterium]
ARGGSAPSWVGEADWVQYRLSERLRGLRLHFVNVQGTATAADRARSAVRRLASAGAASLAGVMRAAGARAADPQPQIVSRAAWGAADCPPRRAPDYGEVRAAFVHHTVNSNDYTRSEAPSVVLGICRFHRNTNGWNDIGYNFLVDRFGTIYEGRAGGIDQPVVGAQAEGYNTQSTGIANLGTFTSLRQTPEAMRAMARVIRWKLPIHGAPTAGGTTLVSAGGSSNRFAAGRSVPVQRVIGHRDTGATSCPGEALYAQLPELRRLVGNLGPSGVATQLLAEVGGRRRSVRFGQTALVAGRLSAAGGAALARQPVEVQAFIGRRWRTVAAGSTGDAGHFAATVKPMRNRSLRARYAGSGDLRPATSPTFHVGVQPIVSISRTARRASRSTRVVVRGRVLPRKARVYQVLQQRRGRGFRTLATTALKVGRDGRFRGSFAPARSGTYRFYVVARGDHATARSSSSKLLLRVGRSRGGGATAP